MVLGLLGSNQVAAIESIAVVLGGIVSFASFALVTTPFRFWAGVAMAIYAICVCPRTSSMR
jgi:hypothetical protein